MNALPVSAAPRVLFPFVGDSVGGSHISAVELVKELPSHGVKPIIALNTEGAMADYLCRRGIPYCLLETRHCLTYAPLKSQFGRFIAMVGPLMRFLRENQIDVVHTNDSRMHQTWTVPTKLWTGAHLWHQRVATTSQKYALSTMLADRIVTISDYCLCKLPTVMRRRSDIVYNPFSVPDLSEKDRCRSMICQEMDANPDFIIAFVGNLSDQKRITTFLKIAEHLTWRGSVDVIFPIFCDSKPEKRSAIEAQLSDSRFGGRCRLLGPRYPIEPWLAACDILVAPARNEGFGRTLVEAMLCGTVVVASDEGGHREIVRHGETGYLVRPDDPDAFVRAIEEVLSAPKEAEEMRGRAKEAASRRFSAESHAAAMVGIYASLLGWRAGFPGAAGGGS